MRTTPRSRGVLRHIVTAALGTGMRKEEILSLRWTHVCLQRNLIFVAKPKWKGDGRKTKGVPMNGMVRAVLLELQSKSYSEDVFALKSTGRRPSKSWLQDAFQKACEEAGITDFRFHDLRHTFGTRLGERNISPFTVAEVMGHADIKMTARYTHPTEEAKRAAVEAARPEAREDGHVLVTGRFSKAV